jgi:hypothetical protein
MKAKLAVLFFVSVFTAGAANVRFNLRDFVTTTQPLIRRTVEVQPQSTPLQSGTNVILSETRFFNTGTTGEFTATNVVTGTYRVLVYGPTRTNIFRINVPDTSVTTNASAILISAANDGIDTEDGRSIDIE